MLEFFSRRSLVSLFAVAVFYIPASGQEATTAPAQTDQPITTIRASTQLVLVDVTVLDSQGRPVHGLTRDNFRLEENKTPQRLRNFDEHTSNDHPAPGPVLPPLPPGTFTNYTSAPPSGTLNVLLIDALNTPRNDQNYLRTQLQEYLKSAPAGQSIAIFGLNSELYLLQGFTTDPGLLKRAVSSKAATRTSDLLDDPNGTGLETQKSSDAMSDNGQGLDLIIAGLQQFEADTDAQRLQLHAQYTLDALNSMAHYLGNFPGKKNLIWFSGSFPINVLPDPNLANAFSTLQIDQKEMRDTTNLLTRAQVAVYPIDARGLQTQPMFSATTSGRQYAANPTNMGKDINRFNASQANTHSTMDEVATDTGGHAYYNTNGLAAAVASAIDSGSNYYTLAYSPTDRDPNGERRSIQVELVGSLANAGLQLSYRHGYFAREREPDKAPANPAEPAPTAAASYGRNALSHGSPLPQDILFQVSVTPQAGGPVDKLAPNNQLDPKAPAFAPYRQLSVNYAALPNDFVFTPQPDGRRLATIAFKVLVFDPEGRVLNSVSKAVRFDLPPDAYKRLMDAGVGMHLDVSVPSKKKSFVRIAVQDVAANKFGVVELPVEDILKQAPAPAAPRP